MRKPNYASIIQAEAPIAKQRYFNNLSLQQQKQAQEQNANQFNQSLALEKKAINQAQEQAQTSQAIAGATLGKSVYPYAKSGATGLYNSIFGGGSESAIAGQTGLATATESSPAVYYNPVMESLYSEGGAGAGEAAAGGSSSASGGTAAAPLGYIGGAIALQQAAVNSTGTKFEGQPTGGVFTTTNGQWTPRFGNDPWHGLANEKLGLGPSSGEKWDAAMANKDYGKAFLRTPGLVQQWADPIGDFGYDVVHGGVANITGNETAGDIAGSLLNPLGPLTDKIGNSDSIGEAAVHFFTGGLF